MNKEVVGCSAGIAIQIVILISYTLVFGFEGSVLPLSPAEEPPVSSGNTTSTSY
ncbi:hypothetical protein [Brevibacillus nitrificans]|uniref:hypothetical protein n=1 Tax=Brevibacillus nitrificans TaxID=651560 RepID=UPI0016058DA0|nr:hypothetical protein [Brevibacillus nitrificans]